MEEKGFMKGGDGELTEETGVVGGITVIDIGVEEGEGSDTRETGMEIGREGCDRREEEGLSARCTGMKIGWGLWIICR